MSSRNYRMVENRKYNQEEIDFVITRCEAGWDYNIIAKAFKRHFGEYWANRQFTKKQVQYIRTTYKPPPGMVQPYTGPIPEFTPSPEPEERPQPTSSSSAAGRKRRQPVAAARNRSSSNHGPMNQTSNYWQQTPASQTPASEQPGSPVAGPSRKRARTQAPVPSVEGGGSGEGQNVQHNMDNNFPDEANQPELFDPIDLIGDDFDVPQEDPALRNAGLEPDSPGMLLPNADDDDAEADEAPALPNYLDIHPNVPLQSIERHRSIAPGGGAGGINAPNSGVPTPQLQQRHQLQLQQQQQHHHPQRPSLPPHALYPRPYSHRGAVARDDPFGVWYYNPHETCQIWLGHRHDFDGGVWFTSEASCGMSLMAMRHTEGVGFMLGVATTASQILNTEGGRYFEGRSVDPRDLMQQAARVVRQHVPAEVLDDNSFRVPDPADIMGLMTTNRRLPPGNFFDPFHRRVVQYDMSGRGAGIQSGGGGGGGGGGQLGTGAPGPSRQRDVPGDGGAGASRSSRQGTVAPPPQVRGRQRTATPLNRGPSRQDNGAPGPSNT